MLTKAILAGVAGTVAMTFYVYLLAWLTDKNWQVIHILSAVLGRRPLIDKQSSCIHLAVASFLHSLVGILFAVIYYKLLDASIISISLRSATAYGLLTGVLAMLVWRLVFIFYYQPPGVSSASYIIVIGSAHIPFSVAMALVLNWLIGYSIKI